MHDYEFFLSVNHAHTHKPYQKFPEIMCVPPNRRINQKETGEEDKEEWKSFAQFLHSCFFVRPSVRYLEQQ